MTKLIRFLKPFTLMILISIVLLYGQAQAELALPDYLSNIVNVGIQNGGIDDPKPEIFIAEDFDRILLVTDTATRTLLTGAYRRVEPTDADYNSFASKYSALGSKSACRSG